MDNNKTSDTNNILYTQKLNYIYRYIHNVVIFMDSIIAGVVAMGDFGWASSIDFCFALKTCGRGTWQTFTIVSGSAMINTVDGIANINTGGSRIIEISGSGIIEIGGSKNISAITITCWAMFFVFFFWFFQFHLC